MSEAAAAAIARPQLARLDALTADLRILQRTTIQALGPVPGIRRILPAEADIPATNGSTVGLWLTTPGQARRLADACHQAGLLSWWPGPGDLHTAAAWPVQPARQHVDLRCYLDLQIPWLPPGQHHTFAATVASVIAGAS